MCPQALWGSWMRWKAVCFKPVVCFFSSSFARHTIPSDTVFRLLRHITQCVAGDIAMAVRSCGHSSVVHWNKRDLDYPSWWISRPSHLCLLSRTGSTSVGLRAKEEGILNQLLLSPLVPPAYQLRGSVHNLLRVIVSVRHLVLSTLPLLISPNLLCNPHLSLLFHHYSLSTIFIPNPHLSPQHLILLCPDVRCDL